MQSQNGSDSDEDCQFYSVPSVPSPLPSTTLPTPQSFTSYLKNTLTNLAYNLRHSNYLHIPLLQRPRITLTATGPPVYYLGVEYSLDTVSEFVKHFRSTVWLSYRKGIKEIGDDRGWGCMIRAVQMMMAEVVRRLERGRGVGEVLKYFGEGEEAGMSLMRICRRGKIDRRWTSASEIMGICCELLEEMPELDFRIDNDPSGCIILKNLKQQGKPLLLVRHNRLGIDSLEQRYLPHLKSLMQLRYFSGMLGGTPGQAMFIMGYQSNQAIFLDPHYVQNSQATHSTYFKKHPRGLDFSKLSPCISISFSVRNQQQLQQLLCQLIDLQDQHLEFRAIQVLASQHEKQQLRNSRRARKVSVDDFQVLE